MFHYLTGQVTELFPNAVVLDVMGVGYYLNTSLNSLSSVSMNQKARFYIYEAIGENNFDLYGFTDFKEKRFFESLISVSGVGPKAAVSLLSTVTPDAMIMAILNHDEKVLTAAPGIGKKIAQRIILELKDKMGLETIDSDFSFPNTASMKQMQKMDQNVADAVSALILLGYSNAEITPLIQSRDWTGISADQIIKEVLKNMV